MRLTRLQARDWMPYALLDLDFADLSTVAIAGSNNRGKSAIQNAVEMALYGRVGRAIDQRSLDKLARRGSAGFMVRVEFLTGGKRVEVTREKPLGGTMTLSLVVDGETQRGHTLDDTQARIEALVGLPYDALVSGPFMVQAGAEAESGSFVKAKPAARKDLLIRLLGLDAYDRLHDYAKAEAVRYSNAASEAARRVREFDEVASGLVAARAGLVETRALYDDAMGRLTAATSEANELAIALATAETKNAAGRAAQERNDRAKAAWEAADARVTKARDDLERVALMADSQEPAWPPLPVRPTDDQWAELTAAHDASQARWREAAGVQGQIDAIRVQVERAARQRAILPTVPCGGVGEFATCQFLRDVPPQHELDQAVAALHRAEAAIDGSNHEQAVNDAQRNLAMVERARAAYDAEVARREAEDARRAERRVAAERLREAHQEAVTAAFAVRAAADEELSEAGKALAAAANFVNVNALTNRQAEVRSAIAQANADRMMHEPELHRLTSRVDRAMEAEERADAERIRESKATRIAEVYRLLEQTWHRDGVPTDLIEMAVPLIESKANEVLERFPDDLSISIRTKRPTKKGMAEALDIVVTVNGEESDPGLLSVGANFRIDIATRLALSELRSGARVETLFLDEPLAALDAAGREAVLTTLAALRDDFGLILVISHHDDLNDALDARINVEQEGGVSTATLA